MAKSRPLKSESCLIGLFFFLGKNRPLQRQERHREIGGSVAVGRLTRALQEVELTGVETFAQLLAQPHFPADRQIHYPSDRIEQVHRETPWISGGIAKRMGEGIVRCPDREGLALDERLREIRWPGAGVLTPDHGARQCRQQQGYGKARATGKLTE